MCRVPPLVRSISKFPVRCNIPCTQGEVSLLTFLPQWRVPSIELQLTKMNLRQLDGNPSIEAKAKSRFPHLRDTFLFGRVDSGIADDFVAKFYHLDGLLQ
jgi:hypothetical protein